MTLARCPTCAYEWEFDTVTEADEAIATWTATPPPAAPPLDVERLAQAIRNTYLAPSASRDLDAQNIAAEYARLSPEQEDA